MSHSAIRHFCTPYEQLHLCIYVAGSILHLMSEEGVYGVLGLLEEMLCWQGWETRHGGLLGLKYLLAVREDLHTCLLPRIYPHIYRGIATALVFAC